MWAIPQDLFPLADDLQRPALVIAYLAIEFYVADIKSLVATGVKQWIKDANNNDSSNRQTKKRIKASLALWESKKHPFDYAHYMILCDIVDPSSASLPPSSRPQLTLRTFLADLIQHGLRGTKTGPPFVNGGSFQHVLPVALKKLEAHATLHEIEPLPYMSDVLERVWLLFRLHNIPWTPISQPGRATRQSRTIVYNAWSHFGGQRDPQQDARIIQPHQQRAAAVQRNLKEMLLSDADGPWTSGDITIQNIHTILHRHILPEDFVIPDMSLSQDATYIMDTYRYVRDNFALPNPLHQLALIIGIMFSKLAPNVFTKKPKGVDYEVLATPESTRTYLQTLGWETRNKKGLTQQNIFVSMVTTYIIAIYDEDSPLRKYHAEHGTFGDHWSAKHSECFILIAIQHLS